MLAGTLFLALGVAGVLLSGLGTGPIDALVYGISVQSGIGIGIVSISVSIIFIAAAWFAGIRPSWGTAISMTAFAPLLEIFLNIYPHAVGEPPMLAVGIAEWIVGASLIAAGSALMIIANLGVGAYDAATLAINKRLKVSIPKSRLILDIGVGIVAFLLGGPIWIGTLVMAVVMPMLLAVMLPVARKIVPNDGAY